MKKLILIVSLVFCFANSEAQNYNTSHFKIFYTKFDE